MRDFEALDAMFAATAMDEPLRAMGDTFEAWEALDAMMANPAAPPTAPKATYGRDAPVNVTGPSPGMIGPPVKAPTKKKAPDQTDPNEIWGEAEVKDVGDIDDIDDGRMCPEYDIVFKQNVTPEDFFLGVDPMRHAGISCSDELILKVTLPGTQLSDLDLDVRPTFVRIGAPKYKLKAQLGEKIDETKGNAKWDAVKSLLTVTMPIIHDLDAKVTQTSLSNELD